MHGDLTGAGGSGPRDLAALEREPIPLLGRLLRDLPRLDQKAMTDVQTSPAATPSGDHWRAVARSALLAQHAWVTAAPQPAARPGRAHGARAGRRLAETLAVLGPGLSRDLHAAGRGLEAAEMLARTTSGLRVTAFTLRSAVRSADAAPAVDVMPRAPHPLLPVRRPSHLATAIQRLITLLDAAEHVALHHLQLAAQVVATAAHTAADTLHQAGDTGIAPALACHSELVSAVASADRQAVTVLPSDPLPLAQAQELPLSLAALRRSGAPQWRAAVASRSPSSMPGASPPLSPVSPQHSRAPPGEK